MLTYRIVRCWHVCLSVAELNTQWHQYTQRVKRGEQSDEVNFLPFLVFLANNGWDIQTLAIHNAAEARGINTQHDLLYYQQLFKGIEIK